ncbi:MAG: tRNA (adenosine(37)-N6)-threonylcarbamoyltransferase complex transferase subunit TsaD [Clostridiales bacterium]|nr:tRNA (adenosine(37)-N6)-threonylcarbamoyltransferase complex transferase subunit TsaD [Clostridiales bacterium]
MNSKSKKPITVIGIETSCDETSVAVMRGDELLSNVISSQIEIHRRFGGVVPEIASRNHLTAILPVITEALEKAGVALKDIDAVAVTYGAGLVGALLVGVSAAKSLSYALGVPLYAVNHIQAHIAANYISSPELRPPFLAIVASGGHTGVVRVDGYNSFTALGTTSDDAIGEAFDKVARALSLPYPGGPEIDKRAKIGNANIEFISHKKHGSLSYSGLKTAVVNYLHTMDQRGEKIVVEDVCASFQKTAVDMLVDVAIDAVKETGIDTIALAGGVAANSYLRGRLTEEGKNRNLKTYFPPMSLCTDNAAMVARRAVDMIKEGLPPAKLDLNAVSYLKISECYKPN